MHPSGGSAKVLGYPVDDRRAGIEMRRHIAYVGEDKGLYPYMTVGQLIRLHIRLSASGRTLEVRPGRLLAPDQRALHAIEALQESAFLLTIAWPGRTAA